MAALPGRLGGRAPAPQGVRRTQRSAAGEAEPDREAGPAGAGAALRRVHHRARERVALAHRRAARNQSRSGKPPAPCPAPRPTQLNKQYWNAYKAFFNRKNDFFKSLDSEKNTNLQAKYALIEQAEAAQQSADFDEARSIIIRVQKEWKDIGRVPEKQADKIWKRFRAACDSVFERPKQDTRSARGDRGDREERQTTVASAEQTAKLDEVGQQVAALSPDAPGTLEGFRDLLTDWAQLDATGSGTSDRGEEQFQTFLGKYLDQTAGITPADREDLLFRAEVAASRPGPRPSRRSPARKPACAARFRNWKTTWPPCKPTSTSSPAPKTPTSCARSTKAA
ncbi:MAG: DUF349 domain-containing protein [Hymenobacter sp.]